MKKIMLSLICLLFFVNFAYSTTLDFDFETWGDPIWYEIGDVDRSDNLYEQHKIFFEVDKKSVGGTDLLKIDLTMPPSYDEESMSISEQNAIVCFKEPSGSIIGVASGYHDCLSINLSEHNGILSLNISIDDEGMKTYNGSNGYRYYSVNITYVINNFIERQGSQHVFSFRSSFLEGCALYNLYIHFPQGAKPQEPHEDGVELYYSPQKNRYSIGYSSHLDVEECRKNFDFGTITYVMVDEVEKRLPFLWAVLGGIIVYCLTIVTGLLNSGPIQKRINYDSLQFWWCLAFLILALAFVYFSEISLNDLYWVILIFVIGEVVLAITPKQNFKKVHFILKKYGGIMMSLRRKKDYSYLAKLNQKQLRAHLDFVFLTIKGCDSVRYILILSVSVFGALFASLLTLYTQLLDALGTKVSLEIWVSILLVVPPLFLSLCLITILALVVIYVFKDSKEKEAQEIIKRMK